jgi:serine/threonine protein phosphatase PrpC
MAMATVTMITDRRLFVLNVGSYDIVIFRETREGVMLAGHGLHQPSEVSRLATSIKPDAKADLARGDPNLPTRAFGPAKSYYYTVPPVIVSYSLEKDDQFMLICDDAFGRSCDNNYGVAGAYIRGYARQNMKCEMMARLLVDAVAGGRTPAFNGIMIVDLRPFVS